MIYHKKPDGQIEQIETTEENKSDIVRAYNLDKQLAEQRGQEFGIIYNDAESLPDEDKLTLKLITKKEYDTKQAEQAKQKEDAEYELLIQAELRQMAIERIEAKKEK